MLDLSPHLSTALQTSLDTPLQLCVYPPKLLQDFFAPDSIVSRSVSLYIYELPWFIASSRERLTSVMLTKSAHQIVCTANVQTIVALTFENIDPMHKTVERCGVLCECTFLTDISAKVGPAH